MNVRPAAKVRNRETTWYVDSDSGATYIVHNKRNAVTHRKVWTCNCPDFTERRQFDGTECKHIDAVKHDVARKAADAAIAAQSAVRTSAELYQASAELTNFKSLIVALQSGVLPSVKEVLDLVVAILNGQNGRQLWHILTALRGPDNGNPGLKDKTTAEVRGALGIKGYYTGAVVHTSGAFGKDTPGGDVDFKNGVFEQLRKTFGWTLEHHFAYHYVDALVALKQLGYIK